MFVQFSDTTETKIIAVFGCAQDPEACPNQGDVDYTDSRYAAYFAGLPPEIQKFLDEPANSLPQPLAPAARAALDASDTTVLRCLEHAVAVPDEWQAYRATLRAIASGASTPTALPTRPAYPAGT